MYNFLVQSYSTYKGLFYWLNWPGYISNVFLRPIVFIIMFSILGRFASDPTVAQGYALGMALYSITYLLMGSIAQSYSNETNAGYYFISFCFLGQQVCELCKQVNIPLSECSNCLCIWLDCCMDHGTFKF